MLIYDGDCGFCTKVATWFRAHQRVPVTVVAWQEINDLSELGLTVADVSTALYWVDAYGRTYRGDQGAARALAVLGPPWPLVGAAMRVPPLRWLGGLAYPVLARYRHKLPGATQACALPARVSMGSAPSPTPHSG
jgi:predicted DCC family thiol-disulfide oxidoreductase YuxK